MVIDTSGVNFSFEETAKAQDSLLLLGHGVGQGDGGTDQFLDEHLLQSDRRTQADDQASDRANRQRVGR